jgi:hypothetical protein
MKRFITTNSLANSINSKFDIMRKQYTLWKKLKHGETSLGWDASTGYEN